MPPSGSASKQNISRYVIAGAALCLLGLLVLLLAIIAPISEALTIVLIAIGACAAIASTACGFLAVRQIRSAGGVVYGMRMAAFLSLFYPIIVLDLILIMLGWSLLSRLTTSSLVPLAWLVVIILVDYLVIRITWNKAIQ